MSHNGVPRILKYLRKTGGGVTQEQVAAQINVSTSLIGKFETGRLIPMEDTAKRLDELFDSGTLIQETASEARVVAPPEWFQPWPEIEREATAIRWHEPLVIPGLLQTEQYARMILTSGLLTEAQAEEYTSLRLSRQTVFEREDPPICTFAIDEGALRRGDSAVLKVQLEYLLEIGSRARTFIHVIPVSAGLHIGLCGPFMVATVSGGRRVGYVDDQLQGRLVTDVSAVATLNHAWQAVCSVALPRDMSRDLIMKLVSEL